jgi:hypothetical protein
MMIEAMRAVLDAARAFRTAPGTHEGTPELAKLFRAVDGFEKAIEQSAPNVAVGPEFRTPWEEIPAGSFIKAPNGQWYEIADTKDLGKMQHVTLRDASGKEGGFPRMKRQEVTMRDGSRNADLRKALDALRTVWAVEVVEDDSPPWDE